MLDLTDLENRGVTVKKFCGLDIQDGVGCTGEAVGDITAQMEDGVEIPIPVCQPHLDAIMAEFDVHDLST
ncbi:hypothetical protein SEA_BEUFFERT_109 [Streptomyces phage Beuffert]|nr:hypothetical protein SEA_BEUFFERT_109 [Streptomyces phage Beuffert]